MQYPPLWRDYFELCKPRVVALMTLTAVVAMFLAAPPGEFSWRIWFSAPSVLLWRHVPAG